MKLYILSLLLALLAITVLAVAPQKAILVTYPSHTPDHVIQSAMDAIKDAGGVITHEYNLFKGFAAKASVKAMETVSILGAEFNPVIEEDAIVSIDGDTISNGHVN